MIYKNTKIQTVHHEQLTPGELLQTDDKLLYSFNPNTKLMEISKLISITESYHKGQLLAIGFDSGLELICTPDHPIYSFQGKLLECHQIGTGQSVRAFSLSLAKDGHYRVHGFVEKRARHQYVARMVYAYYNKDKPADDLIIHHKDFDKLNNRIDNLELLNNSMHNAVHYPFRRDGGFHRLNHKVKYIEYRDQEMDMITLTTDKGYGIIVADSQAVSGVQSGIALGE